MFGIQYPLPSEGYAKAKAGENLIANKSSKVSYFEVVTRSETQLIINKEHKVNSSNYRHDPRSANLIPQGGEFWYTGGGKTTSPSGTVGAVNSIVVNDDVEYKLFYKSTNATNSGHSRI